ncbi:hypothetical protein M426DRAFT_16171 [Hypoxylon sp. CI-4A]|nr:hypothetical protein M426DRAFT_16171 [Hypoxylon sp. CI-4A]
MSYRRSYEENNRQPSRDEVLDLQRRYSGLDDELYYIPGHRIHDAFTNYKNVSREASDACSSYKDAARSLESIKPYDTNNPPVDKHVHGRLFSRASHELLEPLAGNASRASRYHAERRDSFNARYAPVLEAKGQYEGHILEVEQAHVCANRHAKHQEQHHRYSSGMLQPTHQNHHQQGSYYAGDPWLHLQQPPVSLSYVQQPLVQYPYVQPPYAPAQQGYAPNQWQQEQYATHQWSHQQYGYATNQQPPPQFGYVTYGGWCW